MAHLAIAQFPYSNNLQVAAMVEAGISARAVKAFAEVIGLTLPAIAEVVLIPRRTLERRIADNAVLPTTESERVVRLGRLYARARDVFEDADEAARWLREPVDALGGRTPLEVSRTEPGAREVEQVLGRIEHGVFS